MALTVQQILADANVRVANTFADTDKIAWLNALHTEFFEAVLVPAVATINSEPGRGTYTLNGPIRARKIISVHVGPLEYGSLLHQTTVRQGRNYWTFDDTTNTLTLTPAPKRGGQLIVIRYGQVPQTTFATADMDTQTPDAPEEYHFAFVLGLCARIADAQKDTAIAANYDAQWRAALATASQNLALRG